MSHLKQSLKRDKKVAVIGGGLTGLVAAYRLLQRGRQVVIYEKNSQVGGLAAGFTIEGASLEMTYHHIFKTDTDIIALARELGLEDKLVWLASSLAIYRDDTLYPFMTPQDLLRFRPLRLVNRIRAGVVALYLQKTKNWKKFETITAYQWMVKYAGKQVTEVIWEPLLRGKFDAYYDKVSMAWLWARIHIRANSRQKGDAKEYLGYFKGGFAVLIARLVEEIQRMGGEIRVHSVINEIQGTKLRLQTKPGKYEMRQYDAILATTPSSVFAELIKSNPGVTGEYVQDLRSIEYLGAICAVFSSDQKISEYYWHNVNDIDAPFLIFVNHTNLVECAHYNGKYVYYIGTYNPHDHAYFSLSEEALYKKCFSYLKTMFPDFDPSRIREKHLFKLRNAQHIVDIGYASRIPTYRTPVTGVFLANFSQIYPEDRGTNYAVREGEKVAKMLMEFLQ